MLVKKIKVSILLFIYCLYLCTSEEPKQIPQEAFIKINKILEQIPMEDNSLYICCDNDVENLISAAADLNLNIFELFDCVYRYLSANGKRVEIDGSSFNKLSNKFKFGDDLVLALVPFQLIIKIQMGITFDKKQYPLQFLLKDDYEKYVEIATVIYKKEFGFKNIEPNLFINSYGMFVKKIGIKLAVKKIHLYELGYAAIYAKGFYKPKKWKLAAITSIYDNDSE